MSDYNLGTAWLQVSLSGQGIGKQIQNQLSGINPSQAASRISTTFGDAFKTTAKIGATAIAGITSYFASYTSGALAASDSAQKFGSTLKFAGLDDSKIKALTESTKKYAAQTVYDISDIRNTTAALAANGVEGYEQLAQAAGNLNAVAGGGADTFKTVGSVMAQTAGAGKLVTENWNQLRDAVPGASKRIKDALESAGAYTGDFNEAMANGEITAEEFNKAIMDLGFEEAAVEAASSTATFEGAWGNFQATIEDGMSGLIDIFKGGLTGALTRASDALQVFFSRVEEVIKGLKSIFSDGDYIGLGALDPGEDHPLIGFFFDVRENIETFKRALAPVAGLALGSFGPLLSGLPVVGGLFSGLTGPVGLIIGLFTQMYANSQTFRDGLGAIGSALVDAFSAFLPLVQPIAEIIGQIATRLGDLLGSALQRVAPLIVTVATAFADALLPMFEQVSPIVDVLFNVFEQIADVILDVAEAVVPALIPMVEMLGESFANLVEQIVPVIEQIVGSLQPVIEAMVPVLMEVANQIVMGLQSMMPIISEVIGLIGQIIVALTPLVTFITSQLVPIIQNLMPVVSAVFGTIRSVIESAINVVKAILQTVLALISGDWSGAWEGVKNILSGVWDGIKGLVSGAINTVKETVTSVLNSIKDVFSNIWNGIKDGVTSVWEGIKSGVKEGIDSIYNTITGIKDTVINFFTGAGRWLWDAGSAVINGFVDGIKSGFQWVKDSLSTLTSWLPDWKGPVEVDRVILREAGQLVIGGFIDGMESQYDEAKRSLGGFTQGLTASPTLDATFEKNPEGIFGLSEIVVVDVDRTLIGRMQVEAGREVAKTLEPASRERIREELGV